MGENDGANGRKHGSRLTASESWRGKITSHETFTHDSIDSLGYDWSRISVPATEPRHPLKVYLPQTTEDVSKMIRDANSIGEQLWVRGSGHSSNDLVLVDRGSILLTQNLNRILDLDEDGLTVTAQAGTITANIDDHLAHRGYGLPVIGDHNDISLGGFISVGGISPASFTYGMFIDTVRWLEYVDWEGNVVECSPTDKPEHFWRILGGTGRYGVITTVRTQIIEADKYGTVLRNDEKRYRNLDKFIADSGAALRAPGDAVLQRGVMIDFPGRNGKSHMLGQLSNYRQTSQRLPKRARNRTAYGYLHGIGYVAGRLPTTADKALKYVGTIGVVFSPKYASQKNVEFFADKILDATVGDPTRMMIVMGPLEHYEALFHKVHGHIGDFRTRTKALTFISNYAIAIRSDYLKQNRASNEFCALAFLCGTQEEGLSDEQLEELANGIDDICIEYDSFRYVHTRMSRDPERRSRVDPNTYYARAFAAATGTDGARPIPALESLAEGSTAERAASR
jgi:FAD binding domain-containing protein